ncbi:MAG: hypothetical protein AAB390_03295 [Patescibacteria group bacterium]
MKCPQCSTQVEEDMECPDCKNCEMCCGCKMNLSDDAEEDF